MQNPNLDYRRLYRDFTAGLHREKRLNDLTSIAAALTVVGPAASVLEVYADPRATMVAAVVGGIEVYRADRQSSFSEDLSARMDNLTRVSRGLASWLRQPVRQQARGARSLANRVAHAGI